MAKPTINLVGPNSGTVIPLAWDLPSTYWDSALFWDSNTFEAQKLVPVINISQSSIDIGVT